MLAVVARSCSGGPRAFSSRQGKGIMKTRNTIAGHDHSECGHPPTSRRARRR